MAGLAVAAVAAALMPRALVGVFYDDGIYLALARSLAEGHGYRLLYLPGAPEAVHYPPLYPVFLAVLWKIWPSFPDDVALFRAANAVALGLFAGVFAAYLRRRRALSAGVAAAAALLLATAVPLLAVTTVLFAEPLFLALAAGAWWLADAAGDARGRRALGLAAAAGAVAGLAALTRSIGVSVVAGTVLALAVGRHRREAVAAAGAAAVLLLPWAMWAAVHRAGVEPVLQAGYGTYGDLLRQAGWGWLTPDALWDVLRPLGAVALSTVAPVWRDLAGAPALVVLVVGAIVLTRRAPAVGWSLACYLVVVLLWPYGPDRFLWAALPVLGVSMVVGTAALWRAGAGRKGRVRWLLRSLALSGALPVLAGFVVYQANGFARGWTTSAQLGISRSFEQIVPWVRETLPASAVLAGEDEALLWLYTGRRAVPSFLWRVEGRVARAYPADTLRAFFDRAGVTHVVITGLRSEAAPAIDELLQRYRGYLRTVMMWPGPMMALSVDAGVPAVTSPPPSPPPSSPPPR